MNLRRFRKTVANLAACSLALSAKLCRQLTRSLFLLLVSKEFNCEESTYFYLPIWLFGASLRQIAGAGHHRCKNFLLWMRQLGFHWLAVLTTLG